MLWPTPLTDSDPALERRVLDLFQVLLDLPETERVEWVEAHSDLDSPLRARLMAMLAGDRLANMRTGGARAMLDDERLPERIGAYRITGLIGQGGMGAVYRGERMTGDFDHVAAIKLIRPGALSDALVERFARERQTLASLSHPNIARLFDGGATEGGDPYIVMEYVDGVPLGTWIETEATSRAERTRLFLDICSAVGFAHQNLIVHRDITPSNILVARDGTAKLIDFGIARPPIANSEAAPSSRKSLTGLSLTPGYAAPERMAGEVATTLSDVYSLGILLDKLLKDAADADLSAIIAQASATDPADRYPTVDALADDLKAWRDGHVVAARKGGKRYSLGKFVGRNKVGVAAAGAAIGLLIGAFIMTLVAYSRAETAQKTEAMRFAQLRSLANFMLFDLNDQLKLVAGNTQSRANLASQAQTYLSALATSPGATDDLKLETAQGFIKLARIQGVPNEPNLGDITRAKANLESAEKLLKPLIGTAAASTLAQAQAFRGVILLHGDFKQEDARTQIEASLRTLDAIVLAQRDLSWFEARRSVRKATLELADLGNKREDIPAIADRLESDISEWPQAMRISQAASLDRAYASYYRGLHASMGDSKDQGVPLFLAAEKLFDSLEMATPNDPLILYMSAWNASDGFVAASRTGQEIISDRLIRKARAMIDRLLAIEDRDDAIKKLSGNIKEALAQNFRDQDKYAEAVALQQQVVAERSTRLTLANKPGPIGDYGFSQAIMGIIARDAKNRSLTCASWIESEKALSQLEKRRQLLGFLEGFLPGLRRNVTKCRAGAPLSSLGPLR